MREQKIHHLILPADFKPGDLFTFEASPRTPLDETIEGRILTATTCQVILKLAGLADGYLRPQWVKEYFPQQDISGHFSTMSNPDKDYFYLNKLSPPGSINVIYTPNQAGINIREESWDCFNRLNAPCPTAKMVAHLKALRDNDPVYRALFLLPPNV